jgi:hypothetical protein
LLPIAHFTEEPCPQHPCELDARAGATPPLCCTAYMGWPDEGARLSQKRTHGSHEQPHYADRAHRILSFACPVTTGFRPALVTLPKFVQPRGHHSRSNRKSW